MIVAAINEGLTKLGREPHASRPHMRPSGGDGENDSLAEVEYAFPGHLRELAKESMYEYGSRVGVWRLLRLFDEYDIKATFFACAVAFERNPEVASVAREAGHDLLGHGWRWEEQWRLTREEEANRIRLAVASFKQTWGEAPSGWYGRYGPSINTRELVVENGGFDYDSDAYNDDLPYYVEVKGTRHLVVPYSLTYNDIQGTRSPSLFLDYLKRGFDELWLGRLKGPSQDDVDRPAPPTGGAGNTHGRVAGVY